VEEGNRKYAVRYSTVVLLLGIVDALVFMARHTIGI
jgi:hypothetical protein